MLYLLVYQNEAEDWDERGHRIGFEGVNLLADFRPQWHHVFPKKFLEGKASDDSINALGNIAVIGPEINIRINAQNPMNYVGRYNITPAKLQQQFIDAGIVSVPVAGYENWLQQRATTLATQGNQFLDSLKNGL